MPAILFAMVARKASLSSEAVLLTDGALKKSKSSMDITNEEKKSEDSMKNYESLLKEIPIYHSFLNFAKQYRDILLFFSYHSLHNHEL